MEEKPKPSRYWHDGWELETPTTVRELLRQNPIGPAFAFLVMCPFGLFAVATLLDVRGWIAYALGLPVTAVAWWLMMLGFAKGWLHDE